MKAEKRSCGQCGDPIAGRSDKRFCSEQCRAIANNRNKLEDAGERQIVKINAVLRKNRTILRQASPHGKTTLNIKLLEQSGFNFNYFTHLFRTKRGNTYCFCYDYGYLLLPEEKVLIVNQQPYMEQVP